MQDRHCSLFIGLIALTSGCAFHSLDVALAPVGPPPLVAAWRGASAGGLVVFSGLDLGMPGEPEDMHYHSGYWVYSPDGKLLKYVNNKVGTYIEDPATVSLV